MGVQTSSAIELTATLKDGASPGLDKMRDTLNRVEKTSQRTATAVGKAGENIGRVGDESRHAEAGLNTLQGRMIQLQGRAIRLAEVWGLMWSVEKIMLIGEAAEKMAVLSGMAEHTRDTFAALSMRMGGDWVKQMSVMRAATQGTISDLELMQRVGMAMDAGLTFQQASTALQFLRRYSISFGKDFNQLMQTVFTGLARGSVMMLDDAGIILSAEDKIFKGLDPIHQKQALVNEAIRLMGVKMETIKAPIENATIVTERYEAALENLKVQIGERLQPTVIGFYTYLLKVVNLVSERMGNETGPVARLKAQITELDALRQQQLGSAEREAQTTRIGGRIFAGFSQQATLGKSPYAQQFADAAQVTQAQIEEKKRELYDLEARLNREATMARAEGIRRQQEAKAKARADRESALTKKHPWPWEGVGGPEMMFGEAQKELQKEILKSFDDQMESELKVKEAELKGIGERAAAWTMLLNLKAKASTDEVDRILHNAVAEREAIRKNTSLSIDERVQAVKYIDAITRQQIEEEKKRRIGAAREIEIRHILLFFDANTENVKDASDLAAYSVGLLTDRLRGLSPAISSIISSVQQITVGMNAKDPKGFGGIAAGGWAGIISGGLSVVSLGIGALMDRSRKAHEEFVRLQQAIKAAAEAGGIYAKTLEQESLLKLKQQYEGAIPNLRYLLDQMKGGEIKGDWEHFGKVKVEASMFVGTEAEKAANEINRLSEAIARFGGVPDTLQNALVEFNHLVRMEGITDPAEKLKRLNDAIKNFDKTTLSLSERFGLEEQITDLNREIANADIKAREEQAKLVIENIHKQAQEVGRALDDAMEAQKSAALRAVRFQFDVQEVALRHSFASRLMGARTDPLESMRIVAEMGREIEALRSFETSAGTMELEKLRVAYEAAQTANEKATQDQIAAVERATKAVGVKFEEALKSEVDKLAVKLGVDIGSIKSATDASAAQIVSAIRSQDIIDALDKLRVNQVNQAVISSSPAIESKLDTINATVGTWGDRTEKAIKALNLSVTVPPAQATDVSSVVSRLDTLNSTLLRIKNESLDPGLGGVNSNLNRQITQDDALNLRTWAYTFWLSNQITSSLTSIRREVLEPGFGGLNSRGADGVTVNVTVNVQGGSVQSRDEIQRMYRDTLEPMIVDSLIDGKLSKVNPGWTNTGSKYGTKGFVGLV